MSTTVEELKQLVVMGCRIIAKMGFVDYRGHVSARIPGTDHILIRGRGVRMGGLIHTKVDELITIDLDGNVVEGEHVPPGEIPLHTEVYRARPDVQAICHTHQPLAVAFSIAGKPILPMTAVAAPVVEKGVPVYPSSRLVLTKEQGQAVARALGDAHVCLLRHHGVITVGASVEEAVVNSIWLEDQARMTLLASLIGEPMPIPPEELAYQSKERDAYMKGRFRYYATLVEGSPTAGRGMPAV